MFGAEYETLEFSDFMTTIAQNDIPCSVCLVPNRSVVQMFPGRYGFWEYMAKLDIFLIVC